MRVWQEKSPDTLRGMYEDAESGIRYQDIFGKGNFFLELQDHGIPEQQNVNQQLLRYAQRDRNRTGGDK